MLVSELADDSAMRSYIQGIVSNKLFIHLKDAFVSNCPKNTQSETTVSVLHGQYSGTSYVFNELEKIAKQKPTTEKKKEDRGHGRDPDLEG